MNSRTFFIEAARLLYADFSVPQEALVPQGDIEAQGNGPLVKDTSSE
jgi:hypothetical protein